MGAAGHSLARLKAMLSGGCVKTACDQLIFADNALVESRPQAA